MEKQKNVPTLRFAGFEGGWVEVVLGEFSDIKTGPFGSTLHQEDYVEYGTPIVTVEHLSDYGLVHKNLPKVSDEDKLRLKSYSLLENDIVFSRVGSVDRNSLIKRDEEGWLFSGRLLRIRPDKKIVDASYLSKIFQADKTKYRIRSVSVGQTMASLNTEILKNFTVVISREISEQQKIAAFLTNVDDKIGQLNKKKSLLEQYKKGLMQQIFSQDIRFKDEEGSEYPNWEEKSLGDVSTITMGQSPDSNSYNTREGGLPLIQGNADMVNRVSHPRNWTTQPTKICSSGDLILTVRAPVGAIGKSEHTACIGRGVCAIRNNGASNNEFLYQYLLDYEPKWVRLEQGSTFTAVSGADIRSIELNLPSLEEQTKIANFLSAIDDKINLVSRQLEQTRQYKKGLLQQMFV
ncbi:MAG: restriction endonuclease subunit S [Daejeonella sp.]